MRWVQITGHTYYRFHVAVIDPNGHAAYTTFATMIREAWRVAEGNVYGRNSRGNPARRCYPACRIRHHANVEPYPEDGQARQAVAGVTEMGIAMVPVIGGSLQFIFHEAATARVQQRRAEWFNQLAEKAYRLEDRIGNVEYLMSQDVFIDALTTASQIADRTSRAEKLALLRNAVINSVMPGAPDDDTQQLFFDMLDRFTPTHVRMLKLLADPLDWFEQRGIARPNILPGPKSAIVEAGMPELADRRDLIDRYAGALSTAGLINQALTGMMTENGLWARATTPLALEFLALIADPESQVG